MKVTVIVPLTGCAFSADWVGWTGGDEEATPASPCY